MLFADLLIDSASGNKVISFLDGNAGYNQIFMAKEDVSKTAFHCLGFVGLFKWVVMTFGLKNAGAMFQRAHDRLEIVVGEDEEAWTADEPIEVCLRGNIGKVLGVYSA
jgi:hypothetical protein